MLRQGDRLLLGCSFSQLSCEEPESDLKLGKSESGLEYAGVEDGHDKSEK